MKPYDLHIHFYVVFCLPQLALCNEKSEVLKISVTRELEYDHKEHH